MRLTYMLKIREVSGYVSSCEVSDDELVAIYETIEPIVWTIRANKKKECDAPSQVVQRIEEIKEPMEPYCGPGLGPAVVRVMEPERRKRPRNAPCAQCGKKYTRAGLSRHAKATGHFVKELGVGR